MGILREVDEKEFQEIAYKDSADVVAFFHTPFCGTCKLARQMLESILETMSLNIDIVSCNLNVMPDVAEPYQITSVPCLLIIQNGEVKEQIFAFRSAAYLKHVLEYNNIVKSD